MTLLSDEIAIEGPSGGRSRILVGSGLLARLGELTAATWPAARSAWLVADETVMACYGAEAEAALADAGLTVRSIAVSPGEPSKALAVAARLYDWLLDGGARRDDPIIALGGGVVGDLAGFVAATCLRGMPLVQVPTSLLAMVDSSVGGKTGVNHPAGKNLIGAFYQAPLVLVDPALLGSLPPRELAAGWAEVIKYAFIERSVPGLEEGPPRLLGRLEAASDALIGLDPAAVGEVVRHCIDLKARVVRVDPHERGLRAILNYGHTVGHALEGATGYGRLLHGEAVAIGMRAAASLALDTGHCAAELPERQAALLRAFGLPERVDGPAPADLWPYLRRDKKATAAALRWVLPTEIGRVEIVAGIDEAAVERALALALE